MADKVVWDVLALIFQNVDSLDAIFRSTIVNTHWRKLIDRPGYWKTLVETRKELSTLRRSLAPTGTEPDWRHIAATLLITKSNIRRRRCLARVACSIERALEDEEEIRLKLIPHGTKVSAGVKIRVQEPSYNLSYYEGTVLFSSDYSRWGLVHREETHKLTPVNDRSYFWTPGETPILGGFDANLADSALGQRMQLPQATTPMSFAANQRAQLIKQDLRTPEPYTDFVVSLSTLDTGIPQGLLALVDIATGKPKKFFRTLFHALQDYHLRYKKMILLRDRRGQELSVLTIPTEDKDANDDKAPMDIPQKVTSFQGLPIVIARSLQTVEDLWKLPMAKGLKLLDSWGSFLAFIAADNWSGPVRLYIIDFEQLGRHQEFDMPEADYGQVRLSANFLAAVSTDHVGCWAISIYSRGNPPKAELLQTVTVGRMESFRWVTETSLAFLHTSESSSDPDGDEAPRSQKHHVVILDFLQDQLRDYVIPSKWKLYDSKDKVLTQVAVGRLTKHLCQLLSCPNFTRIKVISIDLVTKGNKATRALVAFARGQGPDPYPNYAPVLFGAVVTKKVKRLSEKITTSSRTSSRSDRRQKATVKKKTAAAVPKPTEFVLLKQYRTKGEAEWGPWIFQNSSFDSADFKILNSQLK